MTLKRSDSWYLRAAAVPPDLPMYRICNIKCGRRRFVGGGAASVSQRLDQRTRKQGMPRNRTFVRSKLIAAGRRDDAPAAAVANRIGNKLPGGTEPATVIVVVERDAAMTGVQDDQDVSRREF